MKNCTFSLLLLGLVFLFASCDNFMKATQTKQELERDINYANSDSYTIKIDYPEGTGVLKYPAGGITEKKVTDVFNITFEPFTDYAFVCWKITDAASGKELPNGQYLTMEQSDKADTKCTFTKKPEPGMQLCLNAILAERPQIISYSPTTTNAIRDTLIQVLFDRDMDPYSIYFTQEELAELQSDSSVTLLDPVEDTQNYYGYIKDGEIYYKNITITNKKTKANLLANFGAPVLDEGLLIIYANKSNPPYDYSQILVNIGKDFFYSIELEGQEEPKSISMSGSKRWMYQVSNGFDDLPLEIKKSNGVEMLTAKLGSKNLVEPATDLSFERHPDNNNHYISKTNLSEITDWNHEGTELYLNFTVQEKELGAGPEPTFKVKIVRESDETYRKVYSYSREIALEYLSVASQEAFYEGTINLADYDIDLTMEGVYTISLICGDKSSNKLTRQFVFANDNTSPAANPIEVIILKRNKNDNDNTYTFGWKPDWDVKSFEFKKNGVLIGNNSNSSTIKLGRYTYNIISYEVPTDTVCNFTVNYTDFKGNTTISKEIGFRRDAINQSPISSGQKYKYGNFPQTKVNNVTDVQPVSIYEGSGTTDLNGNYQSFVLWHDDWVLKYVDSYGSNGYLFQYYEGSYYKVEPIIWSEYSTGDTRPNQHRLIADSILDVDSYNKIYQTYDISNYKILTGGNESLIFLLDAYGTPSPAYSHPQTDYAKSKSVCTTWWRAMYSGQFRYCDGSTTLNNYTEDGETPRGFVPVTYFFQ